MTVWQVSRKEAGSNLRNPGTITLANSFLKSWVLNEVSGFDPIPERGTFHARGFEPTGSS